MKPIVFVLTVGLAGVACERPATAPGSPQKPAAAETVPVLEVVPVIRERLDLTARLPAELTPYEVVALYPRVTGFVDEVLVDRGVTVRRGQLLVRLSAPELSAQRAEAASRLAASRSTFERSRAAAETPGVMARHDLELAEAVAKADEARVQALHTLEGYLLVRAPFDGVITERGVHPGALVGPPAGAGAAPLLRIEAVGRLRMTVAVPETDVGAIIEGAEARFVVRTWPGQRFTGTIRRIARSIEPRTRTMPVEVDVDNAAGKLAPGMFAEVSWPIRRDTPSLFVPASAVAQTTERTFVDRVRDGVIEQIPVQRGTAVNGRVEIFGALQAGELVLRRGAEDLKSGTKVQTQMAPDGGAVR